MNQRQINGLKPKAKPYRVGLGNGLTLRVSTRGEKAFSLQYNFQGRKHTRSYGAVGLAKAKQLMAEDKAQLARGVNPQAAAAESKQRQMTLKEFIEGDYKAHLEANQRRPRDTLAVLAAEFKSWMNKPIANITLNMALDWRNRRLKDISVASVNKYTNHIKALTAYAKTRGAVKADPLADFHRKKDSRETEIRWLNHNERKALIHAAEERDRELLTPAALEFLELTEAAEDGYRHARHLLNQIPEGKEPPRLADYLLPIILLTLGCGLRRQEALQLRWTDIQRDGDSEKYKLVIRPASDKTGKGRVVPLNRFEFVTLVEWRRSTPTPESEWVFCNPATSKPYKEFKRSWASVMKQAVKLEPSLHDVTFRDLRSTFGSQLVQNSVHMLEVSRLMGHSSVTITEKHYAALANDSARAAMDKLDPFSR